jgi:transcriptional regulator with XRE-family HTH domain
MVIGERIKKRREILGLSQEDLAEILGYKSRSTINKIEKGINDISQSKIVQFSDALKTSPAYLMGWDDDQKSEQHLKVEPTVNIGESKLLDQYRKLNDIGKKEAIGRVEELTHIPRYQLTPVFEIRAAHNEAELTEEELEKMRKDLDDL